MNLLAFYVAVLGLVAMLVVVARLAFRAGWKSAESYLEAAKAVTEMAKQAQADRAEFNAALDNAGGAAARLNDVVVSNTDRVVGNLRAVEEALTLLFNGFERGGFVRRPAPTGPGRQHGEARDPEA